MSLLSAFGSLARFASPVLAKVVETVIPGAGPIRDLIEEVRDLYKEKREAAEKEEILKALQITEEKLNAFDRMFILLGPYRLQLLKFPTKDR